MSIYHFEIFFYSCLNSKEESMNGRGIKISNQSRSSESTIRVPGNYNIILHRDNSYPPSLFELCKRTFYQHLCDKVNTLNTRPFSIYLDLYRDEINDKNMNNLEEHLEGCNIDKEAQNNDINGNCETSLEDGRKNLNEISFSRNRRKIFVPADFIEEYYYYLPSFIKSDLCNGPGSRCENVICKKPVFDFAYLEFCVQ